MWVHIIINTSNMDPLPPSHSWNLDVQVGTQHQQMPLQIAAPGKSAETEADAYGFRLAYIQLPQPAPL